MTDYNASALKAELDEHLAQLQVIYDEACENCLSGHNSTLCRMVLDRLSPVMQAISLLSGRAELLSEERIIIQTPEGTLVAFTDGEEGYPGITVELERDGFRTVRLAMIEYTSGESICGYDPQHPWENDRERKEVPPALVEEDGCSVKPALVCRAWPHPYENEELHYRTFHEMDGRLGERPRTALK